MAKQKKKEVRQYLEYINGEVVIQYYIDTEDATNVNDVEYYKDQSNNPLFMAMKEELTDSIHNKLEQYERELNREKSVYKKQLVQMKIDKFRNLSKEFRNTWEYFEFMRISFNQGDVLEQEEIEELKEKQLEFREDVKDSIFAKLASEDKFIERYYKFVFLHPFRQIFLYPFIAYKLYVCLSLGTFRILLYPIRSTFYEIFSGAEMYFQPGIYLFYIIVAVIAFSLNLFITENIIELIARRKKGNYKTPLKKFKKNALTLVGIFGGAKILNDLLKIKNGNDSPKEKNL